MSVQVVIPTPGLIRVETVVSVENVCRGGLPPHYVHAGNSAADSKCRAVLWFLQNSKADFLLILDHDVVAPSNLLSLGQRGVDIVAGVYPLFDPTRSMTPYDSAFKACEGGGYVPFGYGQRGMAEVDAIGGGALCMSRKVLKEVQPAFMDLYDKYGCVQTSEDIYFCQSAKKMGYAVHADFDVRCDHVKAVKINEMVNRVATATMMWQAVKE